MKQASERILKEIAPNILKEADQYPGTEFEYAGNKITKAEHGAKYDYSNCGDPVYEKLLGESTLANDRLKGREIFLKSLKEPLTVVDEDSGEVSKINPPTKKSTSGLNVTIR